MRTQISISLILIALAVSGCAPKGTPNRKNWKGQTNTDPGTHLPSFPDQDIMERELEGTWRYSLKRKATPLDGVSVRVEGTLTLNPEKKTYLRQETLFDKESGGSPTQIRSEEGRLEFVAMGDMLVMVAKMSGKDTYIKLLSDTLAQSYQKGRFCGRTAWAVEKIVYGDDLPSCKTTLVPFTYVHVDSLKGNEMELQFCSSKGSSKPDCEKVALKR